MSKDTLDERLVKFDDNGVPRIGGWLRLLAFGLILMILVGLGDLAEALLHLSEVDSKGYEAVGPLLWFEVAGAICVSLAGGGLCFQLFRKRTSFVKSYIIVMVSIHLFNIADAVWLGTLVFLMPSDKMYLYGKIGFGIAATAIWVWYLLKSRRVKLTFVR